MGDVCKCITELDSFKTVCTNEEVLRTVYNVRVLTRKKRRKDRQKKWNNKSKRFTAYGQFVFWVYGQPLGKNIHKILPNCVYNHIRLTFPSDDNNYTDFAHGANDDILID